MKSRHHVNGDRSRFAPRFDRKVKKLILREVERKERKFSNIGEMI
jgi:hypothetical protein